MAKWGNCSAHDLRPEPTLADLLADPIVFALMEADRVDPRDFVALVFRNVPKARAGVDAAR